MFLKGRLPGAAEPEELADGAAALEDAATLDDGAAAWDEGAALEAGALALGGAGAAYEAGALAAAEASGVSEEAAKVGADVYSCAATGREVTKAFETEDSLAALAEAAAAELDGAAGGAET